MEQERPGINNLIPYHHPGRPYNGRNRWKAISQRRRIKIEELWNRLDCLSRCRPIEAARS